MIGFTDHWNMYLNAIPPEKQDLYFREEYVKLYEKDNERACSFVYQDKGGTFVFPFLRRRFIYKGNTYYDFETAYGYGGPVSNNYNEDFMTAALKTMASIATENNYICGFVRFHPLLDNTKGFDKIGSFAYNRKTIAIDLTGGIDYTWKNEIHTKNRNVIKKGEKSGLEFIVDNDFHYLKEFESLYNSTMYKLGAKSFYYFNTSYYEQLRDNIQNRFLGIVKYQNCVVAGAIFFYQYPYGHYHLAGSNKSALSISPNNFLLWEAAKEMSNHGIKYFHLGGGTDGTEMNSLYLFKRKFSKHEYQFLLGKLIFNQKLYDDICEDWINANPDKSVSIGNLLLKYKY